jgi:pentatricopeptide repeat protein
MAGANLRLMETFRPAFARIVAAARMRGVGVILENHPQGLLADAGTIARLPRCGRLWPQLPEAHFWCARVCNGLISYGWSDDPSADLQESLQAALRAIYLDGKNPYAHYALATACIFTSAEQAILPAEKAGELNPGFALGHFAVGLARLSSGRAPDALGPFQRGLKLSPHDPQNLAWFNLLATAQLIAGDAEGALLTAARALAVRSEWRRTLETMACCYAATGKWDDARRCVREMARLKGPSSVNLAALRERIPQWRSQMGDLLRKAGWTEQSNFVPGSG